MEHNYQWCITCGGRYGDDISVAAEHDAKCLGRHDEPEWCGDCGAELTDLGTCPNDHDETSIFNDQPSEGA